MKKYELLILVGNGETRSMSVFAEKFYGTNGSTTSGYYAFYCDNKIVSCYPIDRTIIYSIEDAEE